MRSKFLLSLILITLPLVGAQCIQIKSSGGVDGGVFKSINNGSDWKQKAAIPTVTGSPKSFGSTDVVTMAQDPSDQLAIYVGTKENGMLYSYDSGDSWWPAKGLGAGRVSAIVVDPKNKCVIYAAVANRVMKSSDCNRSFAEIQRSDSEVSALSLDAYNPANVYIGTANGAFLKSRDAGRTWSALKNFGKARVIDVVINPKDTRIIYAAVQRKGVWKSADAGENWTDLTEGFKKMSGALEMQRLVISPSAPDTLLIASRYGLVRSQDGGASWEALNLLTKAGSYVIYSLAVSAKNPNQIYYATASTFYRSQDNGASWATKKLPTSRVGMYVLVDYADPAIVYVGATKIEN